MTSVKVLITAVVSITIQFALAIAGWDGWTRFFAHSAFTALAFATVVLSLLAIPSGGGLSTGEKEDRSNRWVLGAFGVIALLKPDPNNPGRTGQCGLSKIPIAAYHARNAPSKLGKTSPAFPKWHSVNEDTFAGSSGPT